MRIRWADETSPWIRSTFDDEKIKLGDITDIKNTLEALQTAKDVDLQLQRTETKFIKALRVRFPRMSKSFPAERLSKSDFYKEKCMEPYLELRPRPVRRNLSVGGELDKGSPTVFASISKTVCPSIGVSKAYWSSPLKCALAGRIRLTELRNAKLNVEIVQPVLRDQRIIKSRSLCLSVGGENSYWWTEQEYPASWRLTLHNSLGEASLVRWRRLHIKPAIQKWLFPLGTVSLKSSLGLNLDPNAVEPVLGVEAGLSRSQKIKDDYFLETKVTYGELLGNNCPPDEFLTLGGSASRCAVRGRPFGKKTIATNEGPRDGLFASLAFGRSGLFHPRLSLLAFADGLLSRRSSALTCATAGVAMSVHVAPEIAVESSIGVSPISGQPVWDLRVTGNF